MELIDANLVFSSPAFDGCREEALQGWRGHGLVDVILEEDRRIEIPPKGPWPKNDDCNSANAEKRDNRQPARPIQI